MLDSDKFELFIPSELGYGDSGQGSDIGGGDVLVFTLHLIKINGATTPAEPRGPPPYATLGEGADALAYEAWTAAHPAPRVLAVLRQPIASSKLFLGFRATARASAKAADGTNFAISANSKFQKGKYTNDPIADALKLNAPAVFVQPTHDGKWTKCKTGRPTETTAENIASQIASCLAVATAGKAEL